MVEEKSRGRSKALRYNMALIPTSRPITGTASHKGKISMLTMANPSDQTEALVGNLNLGVNFGRVAANPVTATAGNSAGKVNGKATTVKGTLSTANAIAEDGNSVTATTTPAGTLTGLAATLRGTISDPTGALSGDARMILGGSLEESGGAKLAGGHQTTITQEGGGTTIASGGGFSADKNCSLHGFPVLSLSGGFVAQIS